MSKRLKRLMQQRGSSYPPMPIIVGAPRSGTTLLRFMLDSHPDMTIPPETGFLVPCAELTSAGTILRQDLFQVITRYPPDAPGWHDFQIPEGTFLTRLGEIEPFTIAEGIRAFYQLYASRFGKLRWGDKTPLYCMHLQAIEAILPEAHFIHIIRDGRDVAMSLRQMWFSPGRDIETLATHWCQWVTTARQQGTHCRHYMEVRYEQLIEDTREVLEKICQFLDLEYNSCMLRYHEYVPERLQEHKSRFRVDGSVVVTQEQRLRQQYQTTQAPTRSRVFAWKREMHSQERRRFEAIAGDVLKEFGFGIE